MMLIKSIRILAVIGLAAFQLGASNYSNAAISQSPIAKTVDSFFSALAAGDKERIKSMIVDPLSSQMRALLDENQGYGDILRKQFQGAKARIVKITKASDYKKELTVLVQYPSSAQAMIKMQITKAGDNAWKIASITNL